VSLRRFSAFVVASALPLLAVAQESVFVGNWLLWVESGYEARPAYGTLVIEQANDGLAVYVEGGPVNLLALDGDRVRFDLDWVDLRDAPHVSLFEGVWENGAIQGRVTTADGDDRGAWRATRLANRNPDEPPAPVDLTGIWGEPDYIGKQVFDLTEAGRAADEVYDETLDDPILRCVSDGMIRMSHGPFDIEVLDVGNRIIMLYQDMHEVRRVYLDRGFPEGIERMNESMGYSIGHWEGSTLVIETRGLKKGVWDAPGMPISSDGVFTERWYLDDEGRLHIEFSLDDPENYHRPALMHQIRYREPDDKEIAPYACDPHSFYRSLDIEGRLEEYWSRSRYRL
jgi:hypothetical protein